MPCKILTPGDGCACILTFSRGQYLLWQRQLLLCNQHSLPQTRAEETSSEPACPLFLSYPPCQQFENEIANFVPDKKGRIIFSDAAISRVSAGTLSEGVPKLQVTGRQTNARWQPFVTSYETPSAVVGGKEHIQQVIPLWEMILCVDTQQSLDSPKEWDYFVFPDLCMGEETFSLLGGPWVRLPGFICIGARKRKGLICLY